MENSNEVEVDVGTFLLGLADRLLALAVSMRGLAKERGDEASLEGRVERAIAGDVEEIARRIENMRGGLCQDCLTLEVFEGFRVGGQVGGSRRGAPKSPGSAKRGRARRSR